MDFIEILRAVWVFLGSVQGQVTVLFTLGTVLYHIRRHYRRKRKRCSAAAVPVVTTTSSVLPQVHLETSAPVAAQLPTEDTTSPASTRSIGSLLGRWTVGMMATLLISMALVVGPGMIWTSAGWVTYAKTIPHGPMTDWEGPKTVVEQLVPSQWRAVLVISGVILAFNASVYIFAPIALRVLFFLYMGVYLNGGLINTLGIESVKGGIVLGYLVQVASVCTGVALREVGKEFVSIMRQRVEVECGQITSQSEDMPESQIEKKDPAPVRSGSGES
jgi:hypothetical protein